MNDYRQVQRWYLLFDRDELWEVSVFASHSIGISLSYLLYYHLVVQKARAMESLRDAMLLAEEKHEAQS